MDVDELIARVLERLDRLDTVIRDGGGEKIVLVWAVGPRFFLLQTAKLRLLLQVVVGRTLFVRGQGLSEPLRINPVQFFKSSDLSLHYLLFCRGHTLILLHRGVIVVAIGQVAIQE